MIVLQTQYGTIIHVKFVEWCHCGLLEIIRTLSLSLFVSCSLLLSLSVSFPFSLCDFSLSILNFIYFNRFGNVDHQNMFGVNMRYQFMFLVIHFLFILSLSDPH